MVWGRLLIHGGLHEGESLLPLPFVPHVHLREVVVGLLQSVLCYNLFLVPTECRVDVPLLFSAPSDPDSSQELTGVSTDPPVCVNVTSVELEKQQNVIGEFLHE